MNLVSSSFRLAAVLSCTAIMGGAYAADPAADQTAAPAAAPAAKPLDLPDPVAVVNGEKISRADLQAKFDDALKQPGMDASKLSDDQKLNGYHQLLDSMIIEKLLKAKTADVKVTDADVDAEIVSIKAKMGGDEKAFEAQLKQAKLDEPKLREQIKSSLPETKWIKSQIDGKDAVTDADAEAFYKQNLKEFTQPDQPAEIRASHILFLVPEGASDAVKKQKEAAAEAAYERVKKGEDFAKVANELTEDPTGKGKGGDLNFFSQGQMVPEFDKAAFSMKVGDISKPVKTSFGYHVIKVTDSKPAQKSTGPMPFDQVKAQLVSYLKNQKQQTAVHDVIDKLRADAKIQNNLPELKPDPSSMLQPGAGAPPDGAPEPDSAN